VVGEGKPGRFGHPGDDGAKPDRESLEQGRLSRGIYTEEDRHLRIEVDGQISDAAEVFDVTEKIGAITLLLAPRVVGMVMGRR
jgi:hypothetical protein